jgi:NAD(P)-dependent dehydrogenase (short-subunit alcohol dehydrogenase family)
MDLQLAGKRVLVTGSTSGIGRGIALVLAREGAEIVVHGRNRERAEETAVLIRAACGTAHIALGDLASDEGAACVIKEVQKETSEIDILVNNAGGLEGGGGAKLSWFDVLPEHWLGSMQQNVLSAVRMTQAFVPGMRNRGWGRVINISALGATQPTGTVPDYCAAKAALLNMTVGLAKALARTGVTVNAISPGFTRTRMFENTLQMFADREGWPDDFEEREARFIQFRQLPIGSMRLGRPDDIGALVAYLASALADFVTGANYRIDGGQCQAAN